MSATNSTPIINLPLFIGTDKPAWLTDWNGAMNTIDTAIANLQTAESGTATSLASLAQSVEALSGTVSQHTTAIQTVTTATAGNTGSINTINSLIGNGEPTTEDKTIIGAINEIYAEIGGGTGVAAEDVTYNNTTSGLTATDVQAAINEVVDDCGVIKYDNTNSGLVATNVQSAIDEIAGGSTFKSVRATATGTTDSYTTQLTTLKSTFDTLTADEKREAYIVDGDGKIYHAISSGVFATDYATSGGINVYILNVASPSAALLTGSALNDISSNVHGYSLALYA